MEANRAIQKLHVLLDTKTLVTKLIREVIFS